PPPAPPLAWAERGPLAQAALAQPGAASAARLTVVGRPREVKPREGMLIVTVESGDVLPALPRGLPSPPPAVTLYKVLLGEATWRRVEASLNRPNTLLIADGYAVPNVKAGTVTLLARFATAKSAPPEARPGVMRIQLTGRPGQAIHHGPTVLTALTSRQAPRLPEGVPEPPPVTYLVYSVEKQWRPAAAAGAVQIDGYCLYDAELKSLTVLAQRVSARAERPVLSGPGRRP
ncbi:MAG: hypothetical protein JNK29_09900, partial [Anaerolineales bacterium]|nr:hypothetical protein [Anaerolineales bacterium]